MKFWNLTATTEPDGSKSLGIDIFGVIEPGFFDDAGTRSADIAAQLAEHRDASAINVRINSIGGDTFGGVAIYNLLREHPAAKAGKLTSIVEGLAASAASMIAMAGKTVMQRGSMIMIHNPWTIAMGDANAMRATANTLDAVRDSIVSIYRAKTGKKPAELKAMLDAETWFSADEAKRQGFADDIADAPVKARAEGEQVILNSIAFPRAGLPAPILAMAPAPTSPPPMDRPSATPAVAPIPEPPITREILASRAPDLLAALIAEGEANGKAAGRGEGHADGVAVGISIERARLQAIDALPVTGHAELIASAKYGDKPMTAPDLAVAVLNADKQVGTNFIAQRRAESAPAAAISPAAPEHTDRRGEEAKAASQIAAFANAPRGGVR